MPGHAAYSWCSSQAEHAARSVFLGDIACIGSVTMWDAAQHETASARLSSERLRAAQVVAALREAEGGSASGRHKPGSLLLAADPAEPNRFAACLSCSPNLLHSLTAAGA